MTNEEIVAGNKLIAEFMGAKMIVENYHGINIIKFPDETTKDLFGLKYTIDIPRISEKIHEIMISNEEQTRVKQIDNYYYMHYKNTFNEVKFPNDEYSSKNVCVSKEELNNILKSFNYFK